MCPFMQLSTRKHAKKQILILMDLLMTLQENLREELTDIHWTNSYIAG